MRHQAIAAGDAGRGRLGNGRYLAVAHGGRAGLDLIDAGGVERAGDRDFSAMVKAMPGACSPSRRVLSLIPTSREGCVIAWSDRATVKSDIRVSTPVRRAGPSNRRASAGARPNLLALLCGGQRASGLMPQFVWNRTSGPAQHDCGVAPVHPLLRGACARGLSRQLARQIEGAISPAPDKRAYSSAGERLPDTEEVRGSIPTCAHHLNYPCGKCTLIRSLQSRLYFVRYKL